MKILITGDAGFVGRAFHRALAKQRHEITGIDLVNGKEVRHFFATDDTQFDIVIHLAAIVGGRMTIEGNPLSVASDLAIDADMFQWALRTRPKHIVYFSSSAAYPIFLQKLDYKQKLREIDINLEHIRTPDFTYGWAKLSGEMLASYARAEGLKVTVLRPFSGYGSDQALDYPFPSFIERAKRKADPFEVWGRGTQVRDFVHIDDVVEATFAAVINDVKTMNICSGRPTSFIELA
jgi:nucleoside-diphosphate-sugar epimerase